MICRAVPPSKAPTGSQGELSMVLNRKRLTGGKEVRDGFRVRQGRGEIEALRAIDVEGAYDARLLGRLYPFGRHRQSQVMRERRRCADDRQAPGITAESGDERAIDL